MMEEVAERTAHESQSDGAKFAESLKEDGGRFAESIKGKNETRELETKSLTDVDKEHIRKESGWSDETVDAIKTKEEYEIYKNAGLQEAEVNGRTCLIRPDLDLNYVDPKTGLTNRELMAKGRSPTDSKTGEKITLHHIGREFEAPLAELTESEHNQHSILHTGNERSWRNDPEKHDEYRNVQRPEHWKERAKT
jgi:hypothetical protein